MAFMLWIIINPELRDFMGEPAGAVLEPRITFDYQYPALTFLFAGIIMISFTTIIRHFIIDWEKWPRFKLKWEHITKQWERQSGKKQNEKTLGNATPDNDVAKEMMSNQMKPMAFTMIIAIPIIMVTILLMEWICK